jgi:flagellar motor protein MotB
MDQAKIRKVVALLGSDFDGEILAAARMLRSMSEASKMTITEAVAYAFADLDALFGAPQGTVAAQAQPQAPPPDPGWANTGTSTRPAQKSPLGQRQDKMMEDLGVCWTRHNSTSTWHSSRLSSWEEGFVEDILDRWEAGRLHTLSPKQEAIIQRIISKHGV